MAAIVRTRHYLLVEFDDSELLELAKREARFLLTKDRELYKRTIGKGIDAYCVEGKAKSERLAEIAKRYGLLLIVDTDKSHCPICNIQLKLTPKEQLQTRFEKNTFPIHQLRPSLLARSTLDTNQ